MSIVLFMCKKFLCLTTNKVLESLLMTYLNCKVTYWGGQLIKSVTEIVGPYRNINKVFYSYIINLSIYFKVDSFL